MNYRENKYSPKQSFCTPHCRDDYQVEHFKRVMAVKNIKLTADRLEITEKKARTWLYRYFQTGVKPKISSL